MYNKLKSILLNNLYPISLYVRRIAGTVILLFLARFLSVHDYGLFTSFQAQATFLLLFANLGYNEYILVSSQNNIREVQLKIGLFILNAIAVVLLIILGTSLFKLPYLYLFILVLIRTFFDGVFFSLMLPYFQASKKFNIISFINIFYSIFLIIITFIAYLYKFTLIKFLLFSIALGLFNFIQVSYYSKINYILTLIHIKDLIQRLDKSIFAYIGVLLCSYLYTQIPSLYVSMFVTKEEAALYFSAFTIASIISLLIIAQVQKIVPEMIKTTLPIINKIIKSNLIFLNGASAIIFLIFTFIGKLLLKTIYGQDYYSDAYLILLILTFSNIFIATASVYGAYITASENQKMKIPMQMESIAITVVCLIILYKFSIYGAAISYLAAAIYIAFRYTIAAKKLLKIKASA